MGGVGRESAKDSKGSNQSERGVGEEEVRGFESARWDDTWEFDSLEIGVDL